MLTCLYVTCLLIEFLLTGVYVDRGLRCFSAWGRKKGYRTLKERTMLFLAREAAEIIPTWVKKDFSHGWLYIDCLRTLLFGWRIVLESTVIGVLTSNFRTSGLASKEPWMTDTDARFSHHDEACFFLDNYLLFKGDMVTPVAYVLYGIRSFMLTQNRSSLPAQENILPKHTVDTHS